MMTFVIETEMTDSVFFVLKVIIHVLSWRPLQELYSVDSTGSIPSCTQWMTPPSVRSRVAPCGEWPFQPCVTCPWCSRWPSLSVAWLNVIVVMLQWSNQSSEYKKTETGSQSQNNVWVKHRSWIWKVCSLCCCCCWEKRVEHTQVLCSTLTHTDSDIRFQNSKAEKRR